MSVIIIKNIILSVGVALPVVITAGTGIYRAVEGIRHDRPREVSQAVNGVVSSVSGMGGTTAGALVGSVFGPVGTVVGGFIGGFFAAKGSEEIGNIIIDEIHDDNDDADICDQCRNRRR